MEIKSLPTDNLYKFITIFCIAMILATAYATVSIYNSHLKQYKEVKELQLKFNESSDFKTDKEKYNKYFEREYNRINSDKKFLMEILISILFLSVFGAVLGFFLWKNNLQKYLDLQVKLETIKLRKEVRKIN